MVVVGASVYAFASSELASQHIMVAAVTDDDPGPLVNKPVTGPFTAMAQVNAIRHHANAATGGKTFSELPNVATSDGKTYRSNVTTANSTDGVAHMAGDSLSAADAKAYSMRQTAQYASFLQASLLTSVIAFGVSALIVGLGLIFMLISVILVMQIHQAVPLRASI